MEYEQINLPSLDIKADVDPVLERAYKQAEETQNLTPLIKQELKYTILNRRHKSGQGDVVMEEKKPVIHKVLTKEEVRKKLRRKEQNRRAAQRCREKKKVLADQVIQGYVEEQENAKALQREIEQLKREKAMLEHILNEHAFTCCRAVTPTPISPSHEERTTFQYGVSPVPYPRDSVTPLQDPFDDAFCTYPQTDILQKEYPVPVTQPTCTQTLADLSMLDLDFTDTMALQLLQPASPELQNGGRRSISDYIDSDALPGL